MYNRVLLKVSGEALAGEKKIGIDEKVLGDIAESIKEISGKGIKTGIVVGGGNFWRGRYGNDIEKTTSDYMGILATVINGLALRDALEAKGVGAVLQTAIEMNDIAEPYTKRNSDKYLSEGKVVIYAAGTGHPFFSTDTCAALRAAEMNADVILVAKTIDGVYSADPKIDKSAIKYESISYREILNQNLKVMDSAAIAICMENNILLVVFSIYDYKNIVKAANGDKIGTLVK